MNISLEETIAKLDEAKRRGLLGIYGIKISRILKLLRELQERRKADNEIPFGDSHSFTELDSIINAYEVHGGYHKKVVELMKELAERRKLPEIIYCKDCKHYKIDHPKANGYHCCYRCHNIFPMKETDFCSKAVRRTDD